MKATRDAITEYNLELPKAIEALKFQLLGLKPSQSRNNESAIDTNTDVPYLPQADIG